MIDITSFMDWFLVEFAKMFGICINTLDRIHFWGFSLLDYLIGIIILGAMLTVLFTFAPSTANMVVSYERGRSKDKKGSDKKHE